MPSPSPVPSSLFPFLAALLGLVFGSFLNVCIARLPQRRSIVRPGSACPRCGASIRAWDNIPLLSYLMLRGRCRRCRTLIPLRYPLVELCLAGLWCACAAWIPGGLAAAEAAVLCFFLLGLAVMDLETMRLPDSFTLPGALTGLGVSFLPGGGLLSALHLAAHAPFAVPRLPAPLSSVGAALGAASLLYAVRLLYRLVRGREGMGLGDIKLALLLGAWLGVAGVALSLFLGILMAAVAGLALLRRLSGAGRLPLGLFLCAGAVAALFAGRPLLDWYFHFWR